MIRLSTRSRLLSMGLAGMLAVGVVGAASVAVADRGDRPPAAGQRDGARDHQIGKIGLAQLIEASGLDPQVVREGLQAGNTLAEVFIANGVNPDQVAREVLTNLDARLDAAVLDGKLSQEQANRIFEAAKVAIQRLIQAEGLGGDGGHDRPGNILRNQIQLAAETIGITPRELLAEMKDGNTIAEVALENGVAPQAVIDALVAQANTAIDRLVAEGKLTPEQGVAAKAKALTAITRLVMEGGPRAGA